MSLFTQQPSAPGKTPAATSATILRSQLYAAHRVIANTIEGLETALSDKNALYTQAELATALGADHARVVKSLVKLKEFKTQLEEIDHE
ncbi:MAG: hypothetical protein IAE97_00185 [Chthoniobacterales bacterium]|nr:hypothetical protein [Chthoniobacterales bacterium]